MLVTAADELVSAPATPSGRVTLRLIDKTTKTSRSSGDRFKSTSAWLNVLIAVSVTSNPIAIGLDVDLSPLGITYDDRNRCISIMVLLPPLTYDESSRVLRSSTSPTSKSHR